MAKPLRKWTRVVAGALVGAVVICGSAAARGGQCTEISTVWTLGSLFTDGLTPTRIYGDGNSYTDGTPGVTARIRSCSTNDAVLMVGDRGERRVMFSFAGAFLGTSYSNPPSWTAGPAFGSTPSIHKGGCSGSPCTVVNVANVLNGGSAPRSSYYTLYTRLNTAFVAPDNTSYHVYMHSEATADVASNPNDAFVNAPFANARVVVEHYPANYQGAGNKEYWLAYPESPDALNSLSPSPENGTLMSNDKTINYGQFTMPFYFRIDAK